MHEFPITVMNYERIIEASYKHFSLKRDVWFLLLFWIAFPIIVLIPWAFEKNIFGSESKAFLLVIYEIVYLVAVLGFIILNNYFLSQKNINSPKITLKRFLLIFPLVFIEMWYLFVWNLTNKYLRVTQILLLLGIPLFTYYFATVKSNFIFYSLVFFLFCYTLLIIHNFVRLLFTVPIYLSKDISVFEAPKESWGLTQNKFESTLVALVLSIGVITIIFFAITIILAFMADIVLSNFFISSIAKDLALRGAYLFALAPALIFYYSGISEIFTQLLKEKESSMRIKNLLTKKVFAEKKFAYKPKTKKKTILKKNKRK